MRIQKGSLLLQHGSWHVRFYQDGKRKSLRVAPEGTDQKTVRQLAATLMHEVNSGKVEAIDQRRPEVMVFDFWTDTFLPWATDNLKPSSTHGYKKLWDGVLKVHFAGRSIEGYKTFHGSEFLSSLAPRMTRNSLGHVRSLSSSIFGHAVNRGVIDRNPWREVKLLAKPKASTPTGHYTMEEAKENLRLLAGDTKAQAAFGLSFFLALRPGELSALRWEDFGPETVVVRRSAWRGIVGQTKTGTEFEVPLIPPAKELFERYALDRYARNVESRASPPTLRGWLFPNPSGARPLDMSAYANRVLRRVLKGRYKGLYSARRGMATELVEATGNAVSAQGMLRHASMATTLAFYKKQTPQETLRGMRLLTEEEGLDANLRCTSPHLRGRVLAGGDDGVAPHSPPIRSSPSSWSPANSGSSGWKASRRRRMSSNCASEILERASVDSRRA